MDDIFMNFRWDLRIEGKEQYINYQFNYYAALLFNRHKKGFKLIHYHLHTFPLVPILFLSLCMQLYELIILYHFSHRKVKSMSLSPIWIYGNKSKPPLHFPSLASYPNSQIAKTLYTCQVYQQNSTLFFKEFATWGWN